jgi:hypothetical protein
MGQTRWYGMSFFDFGDRLDSKINVEKEVDRFVLIDKQLYGLYNIFGNGVIDGWYVRDAGFQDETGITVSVDAGLGVISYMACETSEPGYINNIPPNSIVNIYATTTGDTTADRYTSFLYSTMPLSTDSYVLLARVATGANSILFVDNTLRDEISFNEIIEQAVNNHKHRGTPSKIDLETETKNQLPGARIEGIDASKITSGVFNIGRIPLIDHNDLTNNGMLTHAALDSFVQTLSKSNKELLGEISTTNLLKTIIFLKYLYHEVDENFINELVIIPGVSPNSFIDFDSSTANINLEEGCISGRPSKTGIYTSVYWNNSYAFNNYYIKSDTVVIEDEMVSLDRSSQAVDTVVNFSEDPCFQTETIVSENDMACTVVTDVGNDQGNRVAQMGGGVSFTYYYRKNFSIANNTAKNWDGVYDELVVKVKTDTLVHDPVYMYVVNGPNTTSASTSTNEIYGSLEATDPSQTITGTKKPTSAWVLLEEDENMSSLTEKVFDISNLGLNQVTQITIYTTDDFTFKVDDIYARKTNMYASSGLVRYRYETAADVVFHSIFYEASTPEDTGISIRMKIANSTDLLSRSAYSLPVASGDVFAVTGSAVEIEVSLSSNVERTSSPSLESIELRLLVDADFSGFVIDTKDEWDRGSLTNVVTENGDIAGKSDIVMSVPINVGGRYFMRNSSVSEINDEKVAVLGFSGSNMPISPNQALEWSSTSVREFNRASSVIRKFGKTYLVADTNNNRVLEVNSSGRLVRGVGSTYSISSDLYPLSAVYNSTTKVVAVVFTRPVTVSDISKIYFYVGRSKIALNSDCTVSAYRKSDGKILEITVDNDIAARFVGVSSNLSVYFDTGSLSQVISIPSNMREVGSNSIYSTMVGLACFVGNFTYVENICHPIFVNELSSGNWIVANSSKFYGTVDATKQETKIVPDIVEIDLDDPNNLEDKLISTEVKFSDFSLGSIHEYENNKFIVAGLQESTSTLTGISGSELLAQYPNPSDSIKFRAAAIDALKTYRGVVVIIDKVNNKAQLFYTSPDGLYPSYASTYNDSDFVISESSFADSSGRLIKLDIYGSVVWMWGNGSFNVINSINVLSDDHILISV